MIQIYRPGNWDFEKNGDVAVEPMACDLEAELNGAWILTLTAPTDDEGRYAYVKNGAVLCVPTWVSEKQLFRIYNTVANETEVVAYARPVFFDAADEVLFMDRRPTNKKGQQALDELLAGQSRYKGMSDITRESTAYYIRMNLIEALQSDNENSFLNRWGGEISYNNYTITINEHIGADRGVRVEMGYNCTGMESDVDDSEAATRLVPVSYNGYVLDGEKPWVDSPLINHYPVIKTKTIKFEHIKMKEDAQEDDTESIICGTKAELDAAMIAACKKQFEEGIDKPLCNYRCDMVDLAQTEEYKDLEDLLKVSLGDTVHCKNRELQIDTDARVIKITYDCIERCNKNVELGAFSYNYFNQMSSVAQRVEQAIDQSGNVKGGMVKGIIDGMRAALQVQNDSATDMGVQASKFENKNPNNPMFGAMSMGTQGLQISKKRTPENDDWVWTTAITAAGIIADVIVTGLLASKDYDPETGTGFAFDLDTGFLKAHNAELNNAKLTGEMTTTKNILMTRLYAGVLEMLRKVDGNWETMFEILCSEFVDGEGNPTGYCPQIVLQEKCKGFSIGSWTFGQDGVKDEHTSLGGGKTGKAEFSDGTYLEFANGVLVGGNAKETGSI